MNHSNVASIKQFMMEENKEMDKYLNTTYSSKKENVGPSPALQNSDNKLALKEKDIMRRIHKIESYLTKP
jgi:hypothetical protein